MRTMIRTGDIVVVMKPCMPRCGICEENLGKSAVVEKPRKGDGPAAGFKLRFGPTVSGVPDVGYGFARAQLYRVGLKA